MTEVLPPETISPIKIVHQTEKAMLVEYLDTQAWVPFSQLLNISADETSITIPGWLYNKTFRNANEPNIIRVPENTDDH